MVPLGLDHSLPLHGAKRSEEGEDVIALMSEHRQLDYIKDLMETVRKYQ